LNISGNSSYFTLANGGYIIKIRPIAIGIFVEPIDREFKNCGALEKNEPIATPAAIVMKIHRVKYLSKNERRRLLQVVMPTTPVLLVV
jgi:hypothetical protein